MFGILLSTTRTIAMTIPFNSLYHTGKEMDYVREVIMSSRWSGFAKFSKRCETWLQDKTGCHKAMLVSSCTAALEMAAMLIDIQPGDEIIMPSYTFVSTANAFVLRGGMPVFVDIRSDTFNIDESQIEAAITPKTKAIVVVHYAGVACNMQAILELAYKHDLWLLEDNAHGLLSTYKDHPLGSMGHLSTLSFHETKNITCGQGGAILINDEQLLERAHVLRDKGTNRDAFEHGNAAYYSWVDIGSNYCLSEIQAAVLWAQFEAAEWIIQTRMDAWNTYADAFAKLASKHLVLPTIPQDCKHNGHIYPLRVAQPQWRDQLIAFLMQHGVNAHFHYVPLHTSPAYGKIYSANHSSTAPHLPVTTHAYETLVRLPMWAGVSKHQPQVIEAITQWLAQLPAD